MGLCHWDFWMCSCNIGLTFSLLVYWTLMLEDDSFDYQSFQLHGPDNIHRTVGILKCSPHRYSLFLGYCETCLFQRNTIFNTYFSGVIHFSHARNYSPFKAPRVKASRKFCCQVADHRDIVAELLRMSETEAGERSKMHMKRWNLPNTYCFSKHLAEQLVSSYHRKPFPVCIIRPSMISAISGDPYPGYTGNLAGGGGYSIAFALGFFEKYAHAWMPQSVVDTIPGDITSSVILAAVACASSCPLEVGPNIPGVDRGELICVVPMWQRNNFCIIRAQYEQHIHHLQGNVNEIIKCTKACSNVMLVCERITQYMLSLRMVSTTAIYR